MIYVQNVVEGLIGLLGGEIDSPLKSDHATFKNAVKLVEEWKTNKTRWLAEMANHFGAVTMQTPDCSNRHEDQHSCYQREGGRKYRNSKHRPLWAYSEDKMCEACRAHWHFNMASVLLHNIASKEAHYEAIEKRERGEA